MQECGTGNLNVPVIGKITRGGDASMAPTGVAPAVDAPLSAAPSLITACSLPHLGS